MTLAPINLHEVVNVQCVDDEAGAPLPLLATDALGRPAVVPAGERWLLASVEMVNVDTSARTATLWVVPAGEAISSTNTRWAYVAGLSVAASSSTTLEPSTERKVLRVLQPGDALWVMGSEPKINFYVLAWRLRG